MKNIIKAIVFIFILIVMILVFSHFFASFKTLGKSDISVIGIQGEYKNSLDYLIIGDSESYTSTIPLEIWNNYGYAGYICGTPGQRLNQTYDILTEALKTQNPKVIIIETNALFRGVKDFDVPSFINSKLQLFKYHDNWKYIAYRDYKKNMVNEKGFVYSKEIKKSPNPNYKKYTNKKRKIKKENIKYFEKILDLCKKNKIELILMSVPTSKNWNYKKHNAIVELSSKYKLKFIDFNLDENVDIDWDKDTQDEGDHLNYYGAMKVTKELGNYIDSLNILKSHKKDPKYHKWNEDYEKYYKKYLLEFNK